MKRNSTGILMVLMGLLAAGAGMGRAEDSAYTRWYMDFRARDTDPTVGVHDLWGLAFGANLNRYFGAELAADTFEREFSAPGHGVIGEYSVNTVLPQLRLRYPLYHDRFVPYVIGGFGAAFTQFNDRKPHGVGLAVRTEDNALVGTVGAGFDYFIADNVAIGLEGRYLAAERQVSSVNGIKDHTDISSWLATLQLRVFFSELHPQPLPEARTPIPSRLYFGVHGGGAALLRSEIAPGMSARTEPPAKGPFNELVGAEVGLNLGRYWGLELSVEGHEVVVEADGIGALGEYSFDPVLLQARGRFPLADGRIWPYGVVGLGGAYFEFNDRKPNGVGVDVNMTGIGFAAALGAGLEYYVASNFAVSLEAKYVHANGQTVQVDGGPKNDGKFDAIFLSLGFRLHLASMRTGARSSQ